MFKIFMCGYNFIYLLLQNILQIASVFTKSILSPKIRDWIALRNNSDFFAKSLPPKTAKRIWFHAASGEIEYAKSTIRELKLNYPHIEVYVSYSSPSAPRLFKNWGCEIEQIFPINWDTSGDNIRILKHLKPDLIVFSRTDFWPNLILNASQAKIKLAAIATYPKVNSPSFKLTQLLLNQFNYVSCVDPLISEQLKQTLSTLQICHIPDTRFDQACFRLAQPNQLNLPTTYKYITLGSTWPDDEIVFLSAVASILHQGYKIIWAPHEINHVTELKDKLAQKYSNIKIILQSHADYTNDFDILIIDKIGYLADAYRYSNIAFVGGSFKAKVHSVLEPLCANNIVLVGPHHSNNPEAMHFKKIDLIRIVSNTQDIIDTLSDLSPEKQSVIKKSIQNEVQKLTGGSKKTATDLYKLIHDLHPAH